MIVVILEQPQGTRVSTRTFAPASLVHVAIELPGGFGLPGGIFPWSADLIDVDGYSVWSQNGNTNILSHASFDIDLPAATGQYILRITGGGGLGGATETQDVPIGVGVAAPPLPPIIGSGGILGDVKTIVIVGAIIAGLIIISQYVPKPRSS